MLRKSHCLAYRWNYQLHCGGLKFEMSVLNYQSRIIQLP